MLQLPMRNLGVDPKLREGAARTADPNRHKGYPYGVMPSNKNWRKEGA